MSLETIGPFGGGRSQGRRRRGDGEHQERDDFDHAERNQRRYPETRWLSHV